MPWPVWDRDRVSRMEMNCGDPEGGVVCVYVTHEGFTIHAITSFNQTSMKQNTNYKKHSIIILFVLFLLESTRTASVEYNSTV